MNLIKNNIQHWIKYSLILLPVLGSAQRLSLQDAINLTLKKNYEIQITKNSLDIATINKI